MWYRPINILAIFVVYFDQRAGALHAVCCRIHFLILKQLFSSFSVIKTTFSVFFRKKNAEKHVIKGVYQVLGITLKRVHLNPGVPSFMHVFLCYFCAFPFFPRSTRLLVEIHNTYWYRTSLVFVSPVCNLSIFFNFDNNSCYFKVSYHQFSSNIFFSLCDTTASPLSVFSVIILLSPIFVSALMSWDNW